jgi:ethanolamine utilization protein EutA
MPDSKKPHSLADHLQGQDHDHVHGGEEGADHDHDHFFGEEGNPEDNPLWVQDHVTLRSVGIDIGSSGTQVIFSRIRLRRMSEELSSRYFVVSRETLFQSPVELTPYKSEELIDEDALAAIIDGAFAAAGLHPDDIDTGVVILTGEALRRATTWNRCSRPTDPAPLACPTIPESASSTSTSAEAPPSSRWSRAAR